MSKLSELQEDNEELQKYLADVILEGAQYWAVVVAAEAYLEDSSRANRARLERAVEEAYEYNLGLD